MTLQVARARAIGTVPKECPKSRKPSQICVLAFRAGFARGYCPDFATLTFPGCPYWLRAMSLFLYTCPNWLWVMSHFLGLLGNVCPKCPQSISRVYLFMSRILGLSQNMCPISVRLLMYSCPLRNTCLNHNSLFFSVWLWPCTLPEVCYCCVGHYTKVLQ